MSTLDPERSPAAATPAPASALPPEALPPGTQVGRFVILRALGWGAMGSVHAAFDPKLSRSVALKRVRRLADASRSEVAEERLLREARALARLSHPAVVAVHEAEWIDGHVTLAMELVEGTTMERWLKEAPRAEEEVLALLRQAAEGLSAAHEAGIIHRDVKPSNVLIGADGRAYVSDFGLARDHFDLEETDVRAPTEAPLHITRTGELVGTPAYMAPEQLAGAPASARSDQFSLAVTLFEALAGERPFSGATVSRLLQQMKQGAPTPGAVRRLPRALRPVLLRALRAEPEARFGSIRELLAALDRARRGGGRRVALGAAALGMAVAVAGWLFVNAPLRRCEAGAGRVEALWTTQAREGAHQALRQTGKPFAEPVFAALDARLSEYVPLWGRSYLAACEDGHRWFRGDEARLEARLSCLHSGARQLQVLLESLHANGAELAPQVAQAASALPSPDRCDKATLEPAARSPDALAARDALAGARSASDLGRFAAALPLAVEAQERARAAGASGLYAETTLARARIEQRLARYPEARALYDDALAAAKRGGRRDVEAGAAAELVRLEGDFLGHPEEGLTWWKRGQALLDAYGGDPDLQARLEFSAGSLLLGTDPPQALALHRHALALAEQSSNPYRLASAHQILATTLQVTGELEEALSHAQRAVEILTPLYGEAHPSTLNALATVGGVQSFVGQTGEALRVLRRALSLSAGVYAEGHPQVLTMRRALALALGHEGQLEESLRENQEVLRLTRQTLGPDHPEVGACWVELASTLLSLKRLAEAKREATAANELLTRKLGAEHPITCTSRLVLAMVHDQLGELLTALELLLPLAETTERQLGPSHPSLGDVLDQLGSVRLRLRQPRLALAPLERALTLRTFRPGDPRGLANTRFALAQALWDSGGDRRRAVELAELALAVPQRAIDVAEVEQMRRWVKAHPAPR